MTVKQRRALAAQLANPTRAAAARACGLSESALYKFEHNNPEYAAALEAGRSAQMDNAIQSLNACTGAAVTALRAVVDNPTAPDMAKVAAARALLEFALRFTESAGAAAAPAVVVIDDLPKVLPPAPDGQGVEIINDMRGSETE